MASDDEYGEGECPHGVSVYWNEFQEWSDCAACYRSVARFHAWQAFRDFLNGTPEQWQARCVDAFDKGYEDGFADLVERLR